MNRNIDSDFCFKQFSVRHSSCGMKVGTDGVLLGSWVDCNGARRVLDVGCGCGLLALMIAQRTPDALIEAIDIDGGAIEDAVFNVENSPWADRISVTLADFATLCDNVGVAGEGTPGHYDLIVSNPPFFSTGEHARDSRRSTARHESSLNAVALINFAAKVLSDNGSLAMVLPADMDNGVMYATTLARLFPRRISHVYSVEGKQSPLRTLWQIARTDGACAVDNLYLRRKDNVYTEAFANLTRDFYL